MAISNNNDISVIDCTLRDGGYYNNWFFSKKLINDFLHYMSMMPINYLEIGFRFLKIKNKYLGHCAYSTDKFINSLDIPKNLKLCVMINCSDYLGENIHFIRKNFNNRKDSKIKLVRIASHLEQIVDAIKISIELKKLGYLVAINLMQISKVPLSSLEKVLKRIQKSNVDIFYVADSLGSLKSTDVNLIFKKIRQILSIPYGIHTHDNMNNALNNTKLAIKNGCTWIDGSFNGMGRGPGNCRTEEIILDILNVKNITETLSYISILNDTWFNNLKSKYKWGSNFYYFLSAKYSIHPSYIQTITADKNYHDQQIFNTIIELKKFDSTKFNKKSLNNHNSKILRLTKYKSDALILANGPSTNKFKKIISFIEKNNPLVICLNYNKNIPSSYFDLCVVSNLAKLLIDINHYKKSKVDLVVFQKNSYNYALKHLKPNKVIFLPTFIKNIFKSDSINEVPNSLALSHSLLLCLKFNINKIHFYGVDGYVNDESRNLEIKNTINEFKSNFKNFDLIFHNKFINNI